MTTVSADTNFAIGPAGSHARDAGKGAAALFEVLDKLELVVETSYTLTADDNGKTKVFVAGSAVAVTAPADLPGGHATGLLQWGVGQVTPSASGGGTITSRPSYTKTAGRGAIITLLAVTPGGWAMFGDGA